MHKKRLQLQISKLDSINEKLRKKHDMIFEKIVNAQRHNKNGYAQAYAGELAQVRKNEEHGWRSKIIHGAN